MAAPKVHVKVAVAETDLRTAANLVKPALLYADYVTIYSPAASMMDSISRFGHLTDPRQRLAAALNLVEDVPQFAAELNAPPETLEQLKALLAMDPSLVRGIGDAFGAGEQVDELYDHLDEFESVWQEGVPHAIEEVIATMGAKELLVAVDAGAVKVAELGASSSSELLLDALRAATGAETRGTADDLVISFVARIIEMLTEHRSFPLLDAQSSGLVRAIEREGDLTLSSESLHKGAEISSAASLMGFLPYFPLLPMDEVLDLRRSLGKPLKRFRGALARLSRDFEARPIDATFQGEVENAWRTLIEPALADIREALAESGLLSEVASIALGDPRRLIAEAGGVLAAAHGEVLSLSGLVTASLAAGIPMTDVAGRAALEMIQARREVRKNAFYFLHRLGEEASQRI